MSQPRVISSRDTAIVKVGWAAGFLLLAAAVTWHNGSFRHSWTMWANPLLLWILSATIRLKRVAVSQTDLLVSNFVHEISVPLRDVERVSERTTPIRTVVLELKHDTRLGRRIEFSPQGFSFPTPHPIVAELQNLVAMAGQSGGAGSSITP